MTPFLESLGARHDPWFGDLRLRPAADAHTLRTMLRHELRDTGWPYQAILPAAPFTLPRTSYAELFRATAALVDLIRRTALETGPTTAARLAAYWMPQSEHELFVDDQFLEERYADCIVRPDVVIGPSGPQFLEFNVSGALGGPVEVHSRLEVWRRLYADADGRLPFSSPNPFAVRAGMFRDLCVELAVAPRVALVGSTRDQGVESTRYFDIEADYFGAHGMTARFFEPEDLHRVWDCPPQLRYPIGLRNFTIPDWVELAIDTTPVQEALDNGCLLVGTQTSTFLAAKMTLGLLSEGRPWMSAADRALVERYIPWTRVLSDRRTHRDSLEIDLVDFVLNNREQLVLKESLGMSGKQVILGTETDQSAWETAVHAGAETGTSIVQSRIAPRSCTLALVADDTADSYDACVSPVFGPLLFRGRPAGMWARFFGDGSAGIVSVYGTGSSDNCVVSV